MIRDTARGQSTVSTVSESNKTVACRHDRTERWRTIVATFSVDISQSEGEKKHVSRGIDHHFLPRTADNRRPLLSSTEWMARRRVPPSSSRWPARASGTLARATRSFPRPRYRCINASQRTRAQARDLPVRACQAGFRSTKRMRTNTNE